MFFTGAQGLEMIRIRGGRGWKGAKLRVIVAKRNIQKVLHWKNYIMKVRKLPNHKPWEEENYISRTFHMKYTVFHS